LINQSSKSATISIQEIGDFEKSFDSQIERMTKLTLRMNNFAHAQQNQLQFETASLSNLIEEVKLRLKNSYTDEEVKCKFTIPDHVVIVDCNRSKIADAIMLLISFCINKSKDQIENHLTCTFTTRAENLVIEIANPISSNHSTARENDFNFTLNLADSITKLHKGKFTKTNKSDKVFFYLEMPIIQLGGTNE
jgi:nitrogen-specific signal transduction histidine kinase